MNWIFTIIQHGPRKMLGLSVIEYCVFDVYYQSATNPRHTVNGWAEKSYKTIGDFLGISKASVFEIASRGVKMGLLEVNIKNPRQHKPTDLWNRTAYEKEEEQIKEIPNVKARLTPKRSDNERSDSERQRSDSERQRSDSERQYKGSKEVSKTHTEKEVLEVEKAFDDFTGQNTNTTVPKLPPQELAIIKAIEKAHTYLADYPDMRKTLPHNAKITDPNFDFDFELAKWVRSHGTESTFLNVITTKISSSFGGGWLMNYRPKRVYNNTSSAKPAPAQNIEYSEETKKEAKKIVTSLSKRMAYYKKANQPLPESIRRLSDAIHQKQITYKDYHSLIYLNAEKYADITHAFNALLKQTTINI